MTGTVFNVQDFCVDDGPGIRTTVFLKGCPLRCAWCHNPESQQKQTEISFREKNCIFCGNCILACPQQAQEIRNGRRFFNRNICTQCQKCVQVCPTDSLSLIGREKDSEEIIKEVQRNLPFFQKSGGGLTVSGGEPLFQPKFTLELCRLAQKAGIHVCVETCGYGKEEDLLALLPYVNLFLFDFKLQGENTKKYLGVSDEIILNNLAALSEKSGKIILRCPIIPNVNFNEEHFQNIRRLAKATEGIQEIQLLPYHPLGIDKAEQLGKRQAYQNATLLDGKLLQPYAERLQRQTNKKTSVL